MYERWMSDERKVMQTNLVYIYHIVTPQVYMTA